MITQPCITRSHRVLPCSTMIPTPDVLLARQQLRQNFIKMLHDVVRHHRATSLQHPLPINDQVLQSHSRVRCVNVRNLQRNWSFFQPIPKSNRCVTLAQEKLPPILKLVSSPNNSFPHRGVIGTNLHLHNRTLLQITVIKDSHP